MSQLSPRKLRLLRIEDSGVDSAVQDPDFPLEVTGTIQKWSDFLLRLKNPDTLQCDLLAIDIQFSEDPSGPSIDEISIDQFNLGRYDPNRIPKEFEKDLILNKLVWAPALRCFGKNTGIVMGSLLAGLCLARDLPVGVGVHTGWPQLPACDVTTAMLLAQILAATGAVEDLGDHQEILRSSVQSLGATESRRRLEDVLPEMLDRFRVAFRHRAGKGQHILVEQESLDQLMAIFHSVASEVDLDKNLSMCGIKFYDREGREDCLDVRSIFADKVLNKFIDGDLPLLSLDAVRFPTHAGDAGGEIYQFVHSLYSGELSYIAPIVEFFQRYKNGEERNAFAKFTRPMSKIIALLFAWCYVQAESWYHNTPWDPMKSQPANGDSEFPGRLAQVQTLHHILSNPQDEEESSLGEHWDPKKEHVPLSLDGQPSIMKAVKQYCIGRGDRADNLIRPLRYDRPNDPNLSGRRQTAVTHLLEDLVRSRHLDEVTRNNVKWFKVINPQTPRQICGQTDRRRILEVLGLGTEDQHKPFERILEVSPVTEFGNAKPAEFFNNLEYGRLPSRFAKLCQHFMRTVWKEIPESGWPPCIKDMPRRAGLQADPKPILNSGYSGGIGIQIQQELQRLFMPPEGFTPCKTIYYRAQQAHGNIGGDLIRVASNAEGALSVMFLDAPGKGHAAMSIAFSLFRIMALHPEAYYDPDKMFTVLNTSSLEPAGIYVPFLHIAISPDRRTMKYINAGHEYPLLLRADRSEKWLHSTTSLLGQSAQQQANQKTEELHFGDRIVIYSDGLSEAMNVDGVQFSRLRVAEAAAKNVSLNATEMTEAILDEAHAFCSDCPWEDDVTLAIIAL